MAQLYRGHLGAIMAPTSSGNMSAQAITDTDSPGTFYRLGERLRATRSFTEAAVVTDFVITAAVGGTDIPDSLNLATGELVWDDTGFTAPYTVTSSSGRVYALEAIAGFSEWSFTMGNDFAETTEFQDAYAEFVNLTKRWTAEASAYWRDPNLTLNATIDVDDGPFVVRLFTEYNTADDEYSYWTGLAHISDFSVPQTIGSPVMKRISFLGTKDLYYRSH